MTMPDQATLRRIKKLPGIPVFSTTLADHESPLSQHTIGGAHGRGTDVEGTCELAHSGDPFTGTEFS